MPRHSLTSLPVATSAASVLSIDLDDQLPFSFARENGSALGIRAIFLSMAERGFVLIWY